MSVEQALAQFKETEGGEAFRLQNSKLLKVELADVTIQAKLGSMVAYQGDVRFEHAGSGGVSRMIKKAVTSEGTDLMKISGSGEVFLADMAQEIQLLRLEDDRITANGAHVLAFEAGIDWDIKRVEGASGALAGGLYNMELGGTGWVALVSDGPPVLIEIDGDQTFADPQAAITWSSGLSHLDQDRREPEDLHRTGLRRDDPDVVLRLRLALAPAVRGARRGGRLGRRQGRARQSAGRGLAPAAPGGPLSATPAEKISPYCSARGGRGEGKRVSVRRRRNGRSAAPTRTDAGGFAAVATALLAAAERIGRRWLGRGSLRRGNERLARFPASGFHQPLPRRRDVDLVREPLERRRSGPDRAQGAPPRDRDRLHQELRREQLLEPVHPGPGLLPARPRREGLRLAVRLRHPSRRRGAARRGGGPEGRRLPGGRRRVDVRGPLRGGRHLRGQAAPQDRRPLPHRADQLSIRRLPPRASRTRSSSGRAGLGTTCPSSTGTRSGSASARATSTPSASTASTGGGSIRSGRPTTIRRSARSGASGGWPSRMSSAA